MTRTLLTAVFLTLFSQMAWADRVMHKGIAGSFTCEQTAHKAVFSDNSTGDVVFDSAGVDIEIENNVLTLKYRGVVMGRYSFNIGFGDDFLVDEHHFNFVALKPDDNGIKNITLVLDSSSKRFHLVDTETRVGTGRIFVRTHIWVCLPKE